MRKYVGIVGLLIVLVTCDAHAQDAVSGAFTTRYDIHLGVGIPSGLAIGGRMWTGRDAGIELSIGTLVAALSFDAGVYFPAPSILGDIRPSWTVLASYYRGSDARWYGLSAMYGLLQLGNVGMHAYIRGGASLVMKSNLATASKVLFYPLPAFDVGLSWGF